MVFTAEPSQQPLWRQLLNEEESNYIQEYICQQAAEIGEKIDVS